MARNVKSIVAVKPCGCVSMAHAVTGGFGPGSDDEKTFRHTAEVRGCTVVVLPYGRCEQEEFRCKFNGDRAEGCEMPPPTQDWRKRAPTPEPTWEGNGRTYQ